MKRVNYLHAICIAITIGFVAIGLYRFFDSVGRLLESGRDFGLSIAFYFCELFGAEHAIMPTVNWLPKYPYFDSFGGTTSPTVMLPETFEGFQGAWGEYWHVWASIENFSGYMTYLSQLLYMIVMWILIVLPVFLVVYLLLRKVVKQAKNSRKRGKNACFCPFFWWEEVDLNRAEGRKMA